MSTEMLLSFGIGGLFAIYMQLCVISNTLKRIANRSTS